MPTLPPDNVFDKLARALAAVDAVADPYGDHQLKVGGTVNILGGGAGGTSMTDDSTFQAGSSSLTPAGAYVGGRSVASGHVGVPAMSGSAILQVDVVAGGAGGGAAQNQIQGTAGNWVNVGLASGNAGAAGNWALPVVYASGLYATVNIGNTHPITGSVFVTGLGGSIGAVNLGGSVTAFQGAAPWTLTGSVGVTPLASFTVNLGSIPTVNLGAGVVGSVGVTPLASFTVNLGSIPTVNIGLGTVNVGNVVTATLPAVTVVDTRGSLTATTWPISFGGSGYYALAVASTAAGVAARLHAITVVVTGTVDLSIQSPSGTFLTGSLRLLPGAGFVQATKLGEPFLVGASNATLYLHATGTQNVGGWAAGWVA